MNHEDLMDLKLRLPLPQLLNHLRLGHHAKPRCKSPFRDDQHASWGIYQDRGLWYWKDFGTDDKGDEIDLLARFLNLDLRRNFPLLLQLFEAITREFKPGAIIEPVDREETSLPDKGGFGFGTAEQIQQLSKLRHISVDALEWAQNRGLLVFGIWNSLEVFGVTDVSGKVLELRRLDREMFAEFGNIGPRKCHSVKGTQKAWPVGIKESLPYPNIALVEGGPDFLAAHDFCLREQVQDKSNPNPRCVPVAMLSASVRIAEETLPFFANKTTVIYPHADQPGVQAAARWKQQIESVGGKTLLFDMTIVEGLTEGKVKDLNDLLRYEDPKLFDQNPSLKRIMPG